MAKSPRQYIKHPKKRSFSKKWWLLIGPALILVLFIVWYLNRPFRKPHVTIPSTIQTDSKSPSSSNQSASGSPGSNTSTPASTKANTGGGPINGSTPLLEPWGNFVSNHKPGQNGTTTAETSACNTTPGATCYIKFTNGSLVRSLQAETTDSNGSVIWNWDVKDAGLSSGSWQITAVATLNSQTKSVSDPTPLEVQ